MIKEHEMVNLLGGVKGIYDLALVDFYSDINNAPSFKVDPIYLYISKCLGVDFKEHIVLNKNLNRVCKENYEEIKDRFGKVARSHPEDTMTQILCTNLPTGIIVNENLHERIKSKLKEYYEYVLDLLEKDYKQAKATAKKDEYEADRFLAEYEGKALGTLETGFGELNGKKVVVKDGESHKLYTESIDLTMPIFHKLQAVITLSEIDNDAKAKKETPYRAFCSSVIEHKDYGLLENFGEGNTYAEAAAVCLVNTIRDLKEEEMLQAEQNFIDALKK